jgi:formylglycine-generating enzyme required for sulfatase activity
MEWLWASMGATEGHGYAGSGTFTTGYAKPFAGSDGTNAATDYGWAFSNCKNDDDLTQSRPVGTKLPNELGLLDMTGGAFEWVWDNSPGGGSPFPDGALTDYRGATTWADNHPVYGGSYSFEFPPSLAGSRYAIPTNSTMLSAYHVGFRVARN